MSFSSRRRAKAQALDRYNETATLSPLLLGFEVAVQTYPPAVPSRLRQLNVERSHFQDLAEKSLVMLAQPSTSGNPRPVQTTRDVIDILELVY